MIRSVYTCFFVVIFFISQTKAQEESDYVFISDTKPTPTTIKIGKSELNKFLDTTDIIYKLRILPRDYIRQDLKNGKYYQYFLQDTNKIAFELTYKNKTLVSFKGYWFNDTIKQTGQLTDGLYEGEWKEYYKDGKIRNVFFYYRGWHREYYFYFRNGNIKRYARELEIENKKYRLWEHEDYYANGTLQQKGKLKNGYMVGVWTYYNKDGTIKEIKKHKGKEWAKTPDWTE